MLQSEILNIKKGISEDELERSRTGILSSLIMQGDSSSSRSGSLSRDLHYYGRPRSLAELSEAIESITLENINSFLADVEIGNFTVLSLGPEALSVGGN